MVVTVAVVGPARNPEGEPAAWVLGGATFDDRDSTRAAVVLGRSVFLVVDVFALLKSMPPPSVTDRIDFLLWRGPQENEINCHLTRGTFKLRQCNRKAVYALRGYLVCERHLGELCRDCEAVTDTPRRVLAARRNNGFKFLQRVELIPVGRR